ncbi:MAG TPA: TetR family transcriptional regulator [Agriterribacter sp.]|nr:TetR family transcriptional regulator [Agriterribacter sp.]HRQ51260.1 TetR family transcriptional regulator [Agriterribacter sp.]
MRGKEKAISSLSTEEKIKEAARKVFTRKGYAATRTRDIAEEAGINLALLNYYFRSKQKLFDLVMAEKLQKYFGVLAPALKDVSTSLETKIADITSKYIDLIIENPELPLFVLSEVRNNPEHFIQLTEKLDFLNQSVFLQQIAKKRPDIHPFHFLISLLGMCLFPFLMKPALLRIADMKEKAFTDMMLERKQLIPLWMKAILKTKSRLPAI